MHVERGAAVGAQLVLQDAGSRGEHHVWRGRGEDDEVNVLGLAASHLQRTAGSVQAQGAAGFIIGSEMARMDAGALHNPFV